MTAAGGGVARGVAGARRAESGRGVSGMAAAGGGASSRACRDRSKCAQT
jgi:hypothetical protein